MQIELPKNKQDLFTHLHCIWESLPPTKFYRLQEWMQKTCSAKINARGGFFKKKKLGIAWIKAIIILYSFWLKIFHNCMQTEKNEFISLKA